MRVISDRTRKEMLWDPSPEGRGAIANTQPLLAQGTESPGAAPESPATNPELPRTWL